MEITNSFTVDAPIDQAWDLLTNIPEIAPCLPGAKLTDETDGVYSGGIKIKVGPVTAEYKGSAEFVEKDALSRKVVLNGKGRDTRGAGNAQALITAQMTPSGSQTVVHILTDLKVSGKVAQFGRGVMQDISTKLIGQFVECLEAKISEPSTIDGIAAAGAAATTAAAGAGVAGAAATAAPTPSNLPSPPVMTGSTAAANGAASTPTDAAPAPTQITTPQPAAEPAKAPISEDKDDDNVLDLGDVGLGKSLAKQYGAQAAGGALLILLLRFLLGRRSQG